MPLEFVPVGMPIHAIETRSGLPAPAWSAPAGMGAQLLGVEGRYAQVKLPSGEFALGRQGIVGDDRSGRETPNTASSVWARPAACATKAFVRASAARS